MQELRPYDELPEHVALNPFVRDIYVRNKLIEGGAVKGKSKGKKSGEKMKLDWKMALIIVCFAASGYQVYSLFFAGASFNVDEAKMAESLQNDIAIIQAQMEKATGQEKKDLEMLLKNLQQASGTGAMQLGPGVGPAGSPPAGKTAH